MSSTTHFRLVPDGSTSQDSTSGPSLDSSRGVPSMMSAALLVPEAEFAIHAGNAASDCRLACAEVPLIASLARIRSEADAAIALTGIIETLARQFQVALPCGALQDGMIGFVVPSKVDLQEVAKTIDEALSGQVRATDLQGELKSRMGAQVTPIAPI